ncbi:MAG: undecaprenyl/decaprenyl-phosphate alpha-N-acetylglucosaminyl 1-phosphate transferase [Polyangiaceae bacterium]|nr:undecaprenyl/decaprenyl-phosphate alpha-N-acetylglucosaminyl 1-phosphate transferase [Polyangiaceae bacterium]
MRSFVAAFAVSTVVCGALTPAVRRLAHRVGAVSQPSARHVHERPTPRLGGLAIFVAFFAPLIGLFFVDSPVAVMFTSEPRKVLGLFLGSLVMCGVGVADDTRGMRALYKFLAQIAAGVIAFECGFEIRAVSLPLFGELSMGIFAAPVTVLWVVGIINAVNLIDGLDGLAAGVVFFAAVTNLVVGLVVGADFVCLLMSSMLGAVFAFLFFNFNPARIFMGDSGSYFLGYVLAITSLAGASQKASTAVALLAPVVALGVPIFDTLFTMVRRFLERRPLFSPDRGHIHHRLLDMGLTHRRAVLIIYGVSVVLTGLAIAISIGRSWEAGLAMLVASLVLIGLVKFVGYFEYLKPRARDAARLRSRDGELLRQVLPKAVRSLAGVQSEEDLFAALGNVAAEAQLDLIDVIELGGEGPEKPEPKCVWQRYPKADRLRDDLMAASFCIGPEHSARAALCFRWESSAGEVTPQAEILLEVLVDIVAAELSRLRSPLAPESPPLDAPRGARLVQPSL